LLHSTEVVTCTHKTSKPCCTTRRIFPIHTYLVWGPVDDPSQSLFSSTTPHTHTFVIHCTIADFLGTTMVLEANFPWTTLSPYQLTFLWPATDQFHKIHHRHRVPVGHKGSHPLHSPTKWTACCIHLAEWTSRAGTSIDMRKEVGTTNFSVPYQILWLTVIYGARITGDICY
jgi:hypothetical protein